MEKICILNYENGEVYIFNYDKNLVEDYEEFYNIINEQYDLNLNDSNSSCLISENLKINIL